MSTAHNDIDEPPIHHAAAARDSASSPRRSADEKPSGTARSPSASTPTLCLDTDTSQSAHDEGEQQSPAEPMGRSLTKQTTAPPPPYTIPSPAIRWFIISLVATAAMMS